MSDAPGEKRPDGRGVLTYRWLVSILLAVIATMTLRIMNQIDETAKLAVSTREMASTLTGRLDSQAALLVSQDGRIVRIENYLFFPKAK